MVPITNPAVAMDRPPRCTRPCPDSTSRSLSLSTVWASSREIMAPAEASHEDLVNEKSWSPGFVPIR